MRRTTVVTKREKDGLYYVLEIPVHGAQWNVQLQLSSPDYFHLNQLLNNRDNIKVGYSAPHINQEMENFFKELANKLNLTGGLYTCQQEQ